MVLIHEVAGLLLDVCSLKLFRISLQIYIRVVSKLSSKHRVHSWNSLRSKYLTEKSAKRFNIARHFIAKKQSRQDGNKPNWNPTQHKGKDDIKSGT